MFFAQNYRARLISFLPTKNSKLKKLKTKTKTSSATYWQHQA
jgi:hypothetical protein